jgi:hypothetical protein
MLGGSAEALAPLGCSESFCEHDFPVITDGSTSTTFVWAHVRLCLCVNGRGLPSVTALH